MAIELPNPRNVYFPQVPETIQDPAIKEYLKRLVRDLEARFTGDFDNVDVVRVTINTGTSGSFIASGGATVTVALGLITALT